ncbi:hypothetical protein J3A84_05435 [Proteiniclasticum sp. SCR006]|uniref:Uncharacterized protein n=1 Tax=Proteiniclasticum aestuarii TaxID=2817862 RepID=A0A939KIY6_9CLOT|nr:hypothetical protein [Proteiniclasticum aestuarii]MBO1264481.1 hypothetical protein [Proteiniclasticum aestuarii]
MDYKSNKSYGTKYYNTQKSLITDKFSRLPNWLRWLVAVPAGIISFILFWSIFSFSWFFLFQTKANSNYLGLSVQSVAFVLIPIVVIHDCIPKHRIMITIALGALAIIISIMNIGVTLVSRPFEIGLDFLIEDILQNILTSIAGGIIITSVFGQNYKICKKNKEENMS